MRAERKIRCVVCKRPMSSRTEEAFLSCNGADGRLLDKVLVNFKLKKKHPPYLVSSKFKYNLKADRIEAGKVE